MRNEEEVNRIYEICDELDLPPGQWVLNGSAVLALHGIDRGRPMGDMDVFCSTEAWFDFYHASMKWKPEFRWELVVPNGGSVVERCDPPFLRRAMHGLEVDLYFQWRRREAGPDDYDPRRYIEHAMGISSNERDHLPCVSLGFIIGWKKGMGRAKDLRDVAAIMDYLGIE